MSLYTNVTARYSTQRLVSLTNPDDPTATALNTSHLQYACDDVEAMFAYNGITYDDTDSRHVAVGVEGVVAILTDRMGSTDGTPRTDRFKTSLTALRFATSNDAILAGTATYYQSTVPGQSGRVVRPPFDDTVFAGVQLDKPNNAPAISDSDEGE